MVLNKTPPASTVDIPLGNVVNPVTVTTVASDIMIAGIAPWDAEFGGVRKAYLIVRFVGETNSNVLANGLDPASGLAVVLSDGVNPDITAASFSEAAVYDIAGSATVWKQTQMMPSELVLNGYESGTLYGVIWKNAKSLQNDLILHECSIDLLLQVS